jgi:hypothetical protein
MLPLDDGGSTGGRVFTVVVDGAGDDDGVVTDAFTGRMTRDRLLEGTDSRLRARLTVLPEEDLEHYLTACPVLWTPEHHESQSAAAFAQVGKFERLRVADREVQYTFAPYRAFPPLPAARLYALDDAFGFGEWGWHRTRMVVKEEDLLDILGPDLASPLPAKALPEVPAFFNIETKRHDPLVCVMMPFTLEKLKPVFAKIDRELAREQVHCERADTDLSARRIIDKVASLIYNADAVICDFTGTNPNVAYEAGLAHGWSKRTIFIAEHGTMLPFDTGDEATIMYDNTDLGLKGLWYAIAERLRAMEPSILT